MNMQNQKVGAMNSRIFKIVLLSFLFTLSFIYFIGTVIILFKMQSYFAEFIANFANNGSRGENELAASVILSGGFVKPFPLSAMIINSSLSPVLMYVTGTLLNLTVKNIPLNVYFSKSYWTKFYGAGVLFDYVSPLNLKKKRKEIKRVSR